MARQYDLTVSEVEGWIDEAQRNMENGFRARPNDIREQYETELRETKEALGDGSGTCLVWQGSESQFGGHHTNT